MNRRLFLGPLLSLSAVIASAALFTAPAQAQGGPQFVQYGWWLIANYVNGVNPVDYSSAPDYKDMHVSYGTNPDAAENTDVTGPVNGPTEVSAVQYKLADPLPYTTSPTTPVADLTFPVDASYTPAVSPQAQILACPALDYWPAEYAGNWQDRVRTGGSGCSPGHYDPTHNTFAFTILVQQMRSDLQTIDIGLVPSYSPLAAGQSPDPSNPPQADWRVALTPPTAADIKLDPVASSQDVSVSLPSQSAFAPPAGASLPAGPAVAPALPSQGPAAAPVNRVPTGVAAANPAAGLNALTRGRLLAAALLLLLFIGGLILMGADVQRLLTPAGQTSGIGRFARPRSGPPLPI